MACSYLVRVVLVFILLHWITSGSVLEDGWKVQSLEKIASRLPYISPFFTIIAAFHFCSNPKLGCWYYSVNSSQMHLLSASEKKASWSGIHIDFHGMTHLSRWVIDLNCHFGVIWRFFIASFVCPWRVAFKKKRNTLYLQHNVHAEAGWGIL